jgi:hypothetical protein
LLGWIALGAYQRYHTSARARGASGAIYTMAAALATWLHPVVGAFAIAPLLWGFVQLRHTQPANRRRDFVHWLVLAAATGVLIAAVVLPPPLHPGSLAAKGGVDGPDMRTLAGVVRLLGTPSAVVVVLCLALAAYGARRLAHTTGGATGALGVVLTCSWSWRRASCGAICR